MKCKLSVQEKIKDLRVETGLGLEETAKRMGLSKSALGKYELDEMMEIPHTALCAIADYYGVTPNYLIGYTDARSENDSEISDLHLDDEVVRILKSGTINNRLLCEIIKHPDFAKFLCDMEIYIDSIASMQIDNLNSFISIMRAKLQLQHTVSDSDHYIRTLKESEIDENDYFSRLIGFDITKIAKDLKESHKKDKETGETTSPLSEVIDIVQEYSTATDPMKAALSTLSRQLGMNFNKMDPPEIQFFTTIVEKYSNVYKSMINSRKGGKRKKSS